jgi:hypothetical protein
MFAQEMVDWPKEIRELLIEHHVSPAWLRVGFQEAKNVNQLYDEMRHAGPMPDVPLVMLSSMEIDIRSRQRCPRGTPEALLREEIVGKQRLYTALAGSVSCGEIRSSRCQAATLRAGTGNSRSPHHIAASSAERGQLATTAT